MSQTRNDQNVPQTSLDSTASTAANVVTLSKPVSQNPSFFDYYMKAVVTGLMVGPVSSTLTFPVDKLAFAYQTSHQASPTFYQALCTAFKHPFSGYFPGVLNSACKNVFMFPAKAFFQNQLEQVNPNSHFNKNLAGFFAGILTVYVTSPISVVKALRYNNTPVSQISQLDMKSLFRGVHATALRDGVQFGVYFGALPFISDYINNPVIAGSLAGFVGGFFSNPLSVIAVNQKVSGTRLVGEAVKRYQQGGISSFYRGFLKTTAARMTIQGAATSLVINAAEKIYDNMKASRIEEAVQSANKKI